MRIIVLAKAPVAGRVKTRLCPPCTPAEAASIAEAALRDTIAAARQAGPTVLSLAGVVPSWLPSDVLVIRQRGEGLAARIGASFEDAGTPSLLIGMDTPQLRPALLRHALAMLGRGDVDAVLGPALDGGWWGAGLSRYDPRAFEGVPMSTRMTGDLQLGRLRRLGYRVILLPPLRDVDTFSDALAVARSLPRSAFAAAVARASHDIEVSA